MKQKITIEIQNDTGLQFEEVAEHRIPKKGEYFIAGQSTGIESAVDDFSRAHYFVLTPKIDHELEEAKRKFPVGSYFKTSAGGSTIHRVERVDWENLADGVHELCIYSDDCRGFLVSDCTPFPIPVWRCCKSDKPDVVPEKLYYIRHKKNHEYKNTVRFNGQWWTRNGGYLHLTLNDYEWLDEGGE